MIKKSDCSLFFLKMTFFTLFLFPAFSFFSQESVIIYQKGTPLYEDIANGLSSKVTVKSSIPIEKDKEEDALIQLMPLKDSLVCAIGPKSVTSAFQSQCSNMVAVGIPNPLSKIYSQSKGVSFVSMYPDLKVVLDYFSKTNSAKSFGVIYTNSVNQEMGDYFKREIESSGFKCKLLGVDKAQDLISPFPFFLGQVDVAFLLIDPLAYNTEAVKFMVTKAIEKKKIICAFSEQIPSSGVPMALFVPASSLSDVTAKALKEAKPGTSFLPYFSTSFSISINEQAMKAIGASYDDKKIKTKY
jgi:ABC-type uncharacterized transport system substrate-binding protein